MIVNKLPQLLQERNISLHKVCVNSGVSYPTLLKFYYSDTDAIHFHVLDRICKYLKCKVEDIISYVPGENYDDTRMHYLSETPQKRRGKKSN